MLDAALDAVLDAEMEGDEALSDEDGEEDEDEEEGHGALTPPWPPGEGAGAHHRVVEADTEEKGRAAPAAPAPAEAEAAAEEGQPTEKPPPRNFSRVQDPLHPDRGAFPDFPLEPPVEVAVAPGSMLYLPAGWFHEVGRGRYRDMSGWWLTCSRPFMHT